MMKKEIHADPSHTALQPDKPTSPLTRDPSASQYTPPNGQGLHMPGVMKGKKLFSTLYIYIYKHC